MDIVKDGETGLLVEQRNAHALAEAIRKLLSDEALRSRLGRQGFEHAREYFDWNRIMDEWCATYRSAMGNGPNRADASA